MVDRFDLNPHGCQAQQVSRDLSRLLHHNNIYDISSSTAVSRDPAGSAMLSIIHARKTVRI
jgi:hypothetical protein